MRINYIRCERTTIYIRVTVCECVCVAAQYPRLCKHFSFLSGSFANNFHMVVCQIKLNDYQRLSDRQLRRLIVDGRLVHVRHR